MVKRSTSMSKASLDHAGAAFPVEGLGPGRRVVLWVRGCSLRCPGCLAPELWMHSQKREPVDAVAAWLGPLLPGTDGLTVSGGEPFEQAEPLARLLRLLRRDLEFDVTVYSGYRLDELRRRGRGAQALLSLADLLVDGRYENNPPQTLPWRGSDNQDVHLLSSRANTWARQKDVPLAGRRRLRLDATHTGFRIAGIPLRGDVERLRVNLSSKGWSVAGDA